MKIKGLEISPIIEELATIYRCPYCNKKFFNKNSIRNHIEKKYCMNYLIEYELAKRDYDRGQITTQQFYEFCYENSYIEFTLITDEEKDRLTDELCKKITEITVDDFYEDY